MKGSRAAPADHVATRAAASRTQRNQDEQARRAVVSVIVYTRDEAANIRDCLATVAWSDDVHVVDSHSTDDTATIARALGARVTLRSYIDESEHKNWALANLPLKHDWVFQIDADERCTAELAQRMRQAAAQPGPFVAFRFVRRDFFHDTWIRHTQLQRYSLRLYRRDRVSYGRLVNPACRVSGRVGWLDGYLDHYPFSKGIGQWIDRHNRYSSLEAQQLMLGRRGSVVSSLAKALAGRDFHARRCHLKEIFYCLPQRPLLKFVFLYVCKGGFLDGSSGLHYALLQAMYEFLIVLKTRELAHTGLGIVALQPLADSAAVQGPGAYRRARRGDR
jgi:glycosyltransferase involved in cell wall biosynthesis